MLEMHKTWRNIMREASVLEMRGDIKWLDQKHIHEVNFLPYTCMHMLIRLPLAFCSHLIDHLVLIY